MTDRAGILVGIDEAGYGPLLGPYVLGMSYFACRGGPPTEVDPGFWPSLSGAVSPAPRRGRIAVADSKDLYRRKDGRRLLEEGVLAFLGATGRRPDGFRALLTALGQDPAPLDRYPWYREQDLPLPRETFRPLVASLAARLSRVQDTAPFACLGLRVRVLAAGTFNELVNRLGNKAEVGLTVIGELLRRLFRRSRSDEVVVLIDRQGGRRRYARFLWRTLNPKRVLGLNESGDSSAYRVEGAAGERLTVRFIKGGDVTALPVALASMTAKYVRELHMELLNRYFAGRLGPALRPTAGYVQDGRRFLADIESVIGDGEFQPELLIRQR